MRIARNSAAKFIVRSVEILNLHQNKRLGRFEALYNEHHFERLIRFVPNRLNRMKILVITCVGHVPLS